MSPTMQRTLGAVGTIAVGAAVNIGTGILTDHREVAWWVSGILVLLLGTLVQWWLPLSSAATPPSAASGLPVMNASGNIVGGSLRQESAREAVQTANKNKVDRDFLQSQPGIGEMSVSRNEVGGDFTQKRD